jgi:pimeloyl-ACP methyl ester carboxylesterase
VAAANHDLTNKECEGIVKIRNLKSGLMAFALTITGISFCASAHGQAQANPPASVPTFPTTNVARTGFFYVGGQYVGEPGKQVMDGAMYVEVWVPKTIRHPYPVVFFHGAAQTGTNWLQTPDGRPGWAYYFTDQGYVIYMVDQPARGRSPYLPGFDGDLTTMTTAMEEQRFTDESRQGTWPQARKQTQWPGTGTNSGRKGDPIFDAFYATQVQYLASNAKTQKLVQDAGAALLDKIGPAVLVTHSQAGPFGWLIADARPKLVKGIIAVEPAAPPLENLFLGTGAARLWGVTDIPIHYDPPVSNPAELQTVRQEKPEDADLVPCWRQKEPARKLTNLETIPILIVSSEASYHSVEDHCDAEWLNQAGAKATHIRLESVGIHGNGHMMMLEKNNFEIAKLLDEWVQKAVH